mmetsp:Transcript_17839/g.39336  ORF Transcript_17839/g.39336 Transcript_17839/m.39336 type:complete len:227 (-) Transcript_17839:473-1153(-)
MPPFVSLVAGAGRCFAAGRSVVRSRFSGAPFPPARAGPAEAARFGCARAGAAVALPEVPPLGAARCFGAGRSGRSGRSRTGGPFPPGARVGPAEAARFGCARAGAAVAPPEVPPRGSDFARGLAFADVDPTRGASAGARVVAALAFTCAFALALALAEALGVALESFAAAASSASSGKATLMRPCSRSSLSMMQSCTTSPIRNFRPMAAGTLRRASRTAPKSTKTP